MTRVAVFETPGAVASGAAAAIARLSREAIAARGEFHFALSGGTTPRAAYEHLAALEVDFGKVHIWFGDERAVAPTDPDSNYHMAREALLSRITIPEDNVHRMRGEATDVEEAAREYAAGLPGVLDLALLGMGEDGHTASLFPGSTALDETERRVLPVIGPKPPPQRLTLTLPVLRAARERMVLVTGAGKAEILKRVLVGPETIRELPVQVARRGIFFLDAGAASVLPTDWLAAHRA